MRIGDSANKAHGFGIGEFVGGLDLDVGDRHRVGHLQPDIAINAGVSEVIDLATEWRNLGVFAAVDLDRDQVFARLQEFGQANFKRRVAVAVPTGASSVDPDLAIGHRRVEHQRNFLAGKVRLPDDRVLIGEGFLEGTLVEIVVFDFNRAMRQTHDNALCLIGEQVTGKGRVESPAAIEIGDGSHDCLI